MKTIKEVLKILIRLFIILAALLICKHWMIKPYLSLARIELPPGSRIVEHTNVHRTDAGIPHIYGYRTALVPMSYENAEEWVTEHNELINNIDICRDDALFVDRIYDFGDAPYGYCFVVLRYANYNNIYSRNIRVWIIKGLAALLAVIVLIDLIGILLQDMIVIGKRVLGLFKQAKRD